MGRVIISHADERSPGAFPALTGVAAGAGGPVGIVSSAVVAGGERPLFAWVHELPPEASIRWSRPPVGHLVYVWAGSVVAQAGAEPGMNPIDLNLEEGGVLCVEHGGEGALRAGVNGARLVHFHQREGSYPPVKAGGHAHVVGKDSVFTSSGQRSHGGTVGVKMWLDSTCPTCGLWLHQNSFSDLTPQGKAHYHTEDEIIFVIKGGMVLGRHTHPPGTALAIDANTVYGFGVAEGGMTFINFRPVDPSVILMSREGPGPTRKERDVLRNLHAPEARPLN
jgi:hypothetical protein